MTKPLPFTQASLKRAIAAARAAGLRVTGIRPDGTVLVEDPLLPSTHASPSDGGVPYDVWSDVQA
jgi:hypothetical protein